MLLLGNARHASTQFNYLHNPNHLGAEKPKSCEGKQN